MRSSELTLALRCGAALGAVALAVALAVHAPTGKGAAAPCPAGSLRDGAHLGSVQRKEPELIVNRGKASSKPASKETDLYVGSVICTTGVITVTLEAGGSKVTCNISRPVKFLLGRTKAGRVTIAVLPPATDGRLKCFAANVEFLKVAGTKITTSHDPVFAISFQRGGAAVVRVLSGFLDVSNAGERLVLGPREAAVADDELSRKAAPGPLPPADRKDLSLLAKREPPPDFKPPTCTPGVCTSPTLLRIFRRKRIVVAVDPDAGANPSRFTARFFGFLADPDSWDLALRTTRADADVTRTPPDADVVVTRTPSPRAQTLPFFADRAGNRWVLAFAPDPVFADALTRFLEATLERGRYGGWYEDSFHVENPPYVAVAPLLFATPPCLPGRFTGPLPPPSLSLSTKLTPSGPVAAGTTVRQTVEVTNHGLRLECASVRIRVFGAALLNRLTVRGRSCDETAEPGPARRTFECQVGPLGAGATARVRVVERPSPELGPGRSVQTCAEVDADGARRREEESRQNNGACAELLGRRPLLVGAAEDAIQAPTRDDAKAKLDLMRLAGFRALLVTALWTRGQTAPTAAEGARLANAVAAADLAGIRVFVSVYNATPESTPLAPDRAAFAAFAAAVARTVPSVRDMVIGNEPNSSYFWTPQFAGRADAAARAYGALLARAYDAVKAVDARIRVIGGALAPRGDDVPGPGHDHSPKTFLLDLGTAYRASNRRKPIMDAFAFHPMPESPKQRPDTPYPSDSTALALANIDRLVGLLGRAFDGTAQPGSALPILHTEYGVETRVPAAKSALYSGSEPVAPVAASTQARSYAQAFALAACQPTVEGLFVFHAFDEPALERWQSGVYYADGSPKPSAEAVRRAADTASARDTASCLPRAR